jgi:excisionase family DNA binding protein
MKLLNIPQVADYLQVSSQMIYKLTKDKKLTFYYVGRLIRISVEDLENYLRDQRVEKTA